MVAIKLHLRSNSAHLRTSRTEHNFKLEATKIPNNSRPIDLFSLAQPSSKLQSPTSTSLNRDAHEREHFINARNTSDLGEDSRAGRYTCSHTERRFPAGTRRAIPSCSGFRLPPTIPIRRTMETRRFPFVPPEQFRRATTVFSAKLNNLRSMSDATKMLQT